MANDQSPVAEIIRDEIDDGSQTDRVARWYRLLMHGVGAFIVRFGRLPDRSEVEELGEIVTRIEGGNDQSKAVH